MEMEEEAVQFPVEIVQEITKLGWPVGGKLNLSCWSSEEEQELYKIAAIKIIKSWDSVAEKLNTGRTAYQCFVHLKSKIMRDGDSKNDWTSYETGTLQSAVTIFTKENRIPWGRVAASMLTHSRLQCYIQYEKNMQLTRMGMFLAEEDAVILSFVDRFGRNFEMLSSILVGRSADELAARYDLLLRIKELSTWSVEEDTKLLYIMESWPRVPSKTFFENTEAAAAFNLPFFPGKTIENLMNRFEALDAWQRTYPRRELHGALNRGTWRQMQPQQELITNFTMAISSLKDRLNIELQSIQDTKSKNKASKKKKKPCNAQVKYYEDKCSVV